MKRIIVFIIILGMVGSAYAQCQPCPQPSDWSDCKDNEQTRFVYTCNESTGFNCIGNVETRGCGDTTHVTALWIMFLGIIIGLIASVLLLLKARKKL
ncbi:MAG: hypothetical protein ACE5J7_03905 [Candidatus Aenigmatarchaeota archaeon]